jgi:hypothetical protein
MVGMQPGDLDEKMRPLLPSYMTMGHMGMDMGKMAEVMPMPPNSIPMKGAVGPFGDYISMGGMFTIVKVRDRLASYDQDPGWYQHPSGTVALKASAEDLARDGIDVNAPPAMAANSTERLCTSARESINATHMQRHHGRDTIQSRDTRACIRGNVTCAIHER